MKFRNIAIAALALTIGVLVTGYRPQRAERFREYYAALHQEEPELNVWQRFLVSMTLTSEK